jgi:hypothetical protein
MRTILAAALALLGLAVPLQAGAWFVVRAPMFYHPVAAVAVAAAVTAPYYYAPPPVYVAPQVTYTTPAPHSAPAVITTKLPVNATMWTLPAGCSAVAAGSQTFHVCGPNWFKSYSGANGATYYGVVAPP